MPDIGPDKAAVVLFDETIIVLVIGSTARDFQIGHFLFPKTEEVPVEEFRPIIRMDFKHWKGQLSQDTGKTILHDPETAPKDRLDLTPPGGDIRHLDRVNELSGVVGITMQH